jgi:hypothetical protein
LLRASPTPTGEIEKLASMANVLLCGKQN